MPITKKTPVKTFVSFGEGGKQSIFFRAWRILNLEGPLHPLPEPEASALSADLERMRRQQVRVDEIKRMCHVPIRE